MNVFGIIVLILTILSILLLLIAVLLKNNDNDNADIVSGCFLGLLLSIFIIIIILCIENPVPAIEVYRGNATLKITYQDSVPIDSVVVYKNK